LRDLLRVRGLLLRVRLLRKALALRGLPSEQAMMAVLELTLVSRYKYMWVLILVSRVRLLFGGFGFRVWG